MKKIKREVWYGWEYIKHRLSRRRAGMASPHVAKRRSIRRIARKYAVQWFVETGTYMGDMVAAQLPHFRTLHTIELSPDLYARAAERFRTARGVRVHHGDSAEVLGRVLEECPVPALFWLDAHYSGGITAGDPMTVPILAELELILTHEVRAHVVMIDDARLFTGHSGYPRQEQLQRFIRDLRPDYDIRVEGDIIYLLPPLPALRP